jgi:hypothetical protein
MMILKSGEIVLVLLFVVYLIIGTKTPLFIANGVNTLMGKFVLLFIALLFFMYASPIVSVLLLVVIYELIIRSNQYVNTTYQTGLNALSQSPVDNALNEIPNSLEQEVVGQMAPLCSTNTQMLPASYKPFIQDDRYNYPVNCPENEV